MIRFENIIKRYGNKEILKNISSSIPKGQITSLIGPNGAGKSTLLSVLSRLLSQEEGTVYFREKPLNLYKNKELARQLSILKQSNHMDLKLTVKDLVAFGRFPHCNGKLKAQDWKKVEEALAFSELSDMQDAYLDELSGGQRQRAYIAMIIAQDTDFVLLDEPLNNLDMKHSVLVMQTLRRLVDDLGKTVVLVIHEINFAAQYSDYIIAMKEGEICYQDHVDKVIRSAVLQDIYGIDFEIIRQNGRNICNYFNINNLGACCLDKSAAVEPGL